MRTNLFRGASGARHCAACLASPALAQSVVRGKVIDAQGKPVPDATIVFEAPGREPEDADQDRQERRVPAGRPAVGRVQGHGVEGRRRHADAELERASGPEPARSNFALSTGERPDRRRQGSGRGAPGRRQARRSRR